ncbi:FAD/NAD(P)-binding protein [Telmatospirillum siberiense]|uniref:Ni/Fe hydrogenase subunit gamma n=1 Tax=Telmatospirillum siberiense TaxID=382514 RepID=A0A2N3PU43_9PROT|nr:FAD/NAD(P)-binding protein [Telmatospirillum siberiense]PKU23907.1 Ni/Fe hydrogenase subunit gamma [Telmatospirillum siberiense]
MDGYPKGNAVGAPVDPMIPRPFRITKVKSEVPGVFSWHLVPVDGGGFAYRPGQFNMLYLFGVGEVAISISGDCRDGEKIVHTIRIAGSVTKAMSSLSVGDVIGVRGPFGRPWPVEPIYGSDLVFVTGTIGLAPLRPLIYEVLHQRDKFGRVIICYGSRGTDDILYEDELHLWRGRFDTNVHVTVHSAPSGYRGRIGSVAAAVRAAHIEGGDTQAFVCRSEVMTKPAVDALHERGVSSERIWVTLERNMKCGIGLCGHCQFGPTFMCRDGPVYRFDEIEHLFEIREL